MMDSLKLPSGKIDPFRVILLVVCVNIIFLTGMFIYMLWLEDNPPAEIFLPEGEELLPVNKSIYRSGETMFVYFEFCKYTNAPVKVYRTWRNTILYPEHPEEMVGAHSGECGEINMPVVIPNINPGNYSLHFKFEYEINLFQTRCLEYSTQEFVIQ
jgi:hypothetical protein